MPFWSSTAFPSARTLTCPCVTKKLLYMRVVIDMWSRTPVERYDYTRRRFTATNNACYAAPIEIA